MSMGMGDAEKKTEGTTLAEDDFGPAPGDAEEDVYRATDNVKGGGKGGTGYLWCSCKDASRDFVLPLANLHGMEPGDLKDPHATLHFSGLDVVLEGVSTRSVVHRIFLGRCTIVREIRPGQKPEEPDAPIIRSIHFLVPQKPDNGQTKKPKHEPETERSKA
jgi:hypothetical protein